MAAGSIVDYLNRQGQDSSYSARKKLAQQYGMVGYTGTAEQNTQLLSSIQSGGSGNSGSQAQTYAALPYATVAPGDGRRAATLVKGSGSSNITAGTGLSSGSSSPESSQESGSQYLSGYNYTPFTTSARTDDYLERLEDLENNKPRDYVSRWDDDINSIIDSIRNRPAFETDDVFDSDLYKLYREQYIQQGQKAMRDATGNAAALTGGYGSTYAAAAGQQAYDNYLSQLGDKTLDIYDRVYNEYLQEGQELYNQLYMYNNQDSIDYGRYRDMVSDYYTDLSYYSGRYNQEYANDFNVWQSDLSAQQWAEQYAYQKTQDALAQQNWQTQFDYQKEQDALDREMQERQLAMQYARAASGGSGGGSRGSGSSGKSKTVKESADGYAPIAANVVEKSKENNWNNSQAYNYVMQLGEQGKINQEQFDKILKAAGIDEDAALEQQKAASLSPMDQFLQRYIKLTR